MRYLSVILISCLLVACELPSPDGDGKIKIGEGNEALQGLLKGLQSLSTEAQELAKPKKVEAWVDKLVVKTQPGKDMPVLTRLKEGDILEYMYQRTVRKSKFTLRGQEYAQAWILVKLPDGQMGWVHEGGVRYIQPELDQLFGKLANPNTTSTRSLKQPENVHNPGMEWIIEPGKRVGNIRLKSSESSLIQTYGSANVSRGAVEVSSTKSEDCTILFPNTDDELRITWKDEARTEIKAVYLLKPNARWCTINGLHVGMNMLDVTKANKSPISFYGFDWEYSGTINSWRNGTISRYNKYFYVILTPLGGTNRELAKFRGNQVFSSNTAGIEILNLHVAKIVVYLD